MTSDHAPNRSGIGLDARRRHDGRSGATSIDHEHPALSVLDIVGCIGRVSSTGCARSRAQSACRREIAVELQRSIEALGRRLEVFLLESELADVEIRLKIPRIVLQDLLVDTNRPEKVVLLLIGQGQEVSGFRIVGVLRYMCVHRRSSAREIAPL